MDITFGGTLLSNFVAAIVFALLGVALFVLAFMFFDKMTPGSIWKELLEDQNVAIGNLMGGIAIALAIIIAAAIHEWKTGREGGRAREREGRRLRSSSLCCSSPHAGSSTSSSPARSPAICSATACCNSRR